MRWLVTILLLLGAQFSLTAFAPAPAGRAWLLWPFAADSQPIIAGIGGLPQQSGSVIVPFLAGIAGLSFLLATFGLFGRAIPAEWWPALVVVAVVASILLHVLYAGPLALLPLTIDALLLWGVIVQHWPILGLRGT